MSEQQTAPVIDVFRIRGLHGYKDVELSWDGPARIVIAENGMGKTTILTALYAFLEGKLTKLRSIEFDSIEVRLTGSKDTLTLTKSSLAELADNSPHNLLLDIAQFGETDISDLQKIILETPERNVRDLADHPLIHELYLSSPYTREDFAELVTEIRHSLEDSWPDEVKEVISTVAHKTKQFEILYLPTFRRIEIPLRSSRKRVAKRRTPRGFSWIPHKSHIQSPDPNIQFGLADVSDRLTELFDEIQRQSNIGYRSISASIIEDLLAGNIQENSPAPSELPDIDTLARFFSRVLTHDSLAQRLDSLGDLYNSGNINDRQNRMLRYFLDKLSVVVDQTKEREADIEAFVEKANGYLRQSSDEKTFSYDPIEMKVAVMNEWTGEEIDLDALSSGEKQIVSLLASLYLYPQQKIVLIDEPELSLSIDWQKRLLPDMLNSPSCGQLLAITHSPFIFDNELDPYAGPLRIIRRKTSNVG